MGREWCPVSDRLFVRMTYYGHWQYYSISSLRSLLLLLSTTRSTNGWGQGRILQCRSTESLFHPLILSAAVGFDRRKDCVLRIPFVVGFGIHQTSCCIYPAHSLAADGLNVNVNADVNVNAATDNANSFDVKRFHCWNACWR